ncbi:MAG: archaeosortase A, partial [Thermoplasmata archaeon]|nr:archaeosortase A [Thermoplasmata archaeon]
TKGHRITMIGWSLFSLYWLLMIPHYLDKGEGVNAAYCLLGFPLFLFLICHEGLSIKWGDDPSSLSFMAGTVGISAGMYFLIDTFPWVAAFFVWTTAFFSAGFLSALGYEAHVGGVHYGEIIRVPIYHGDQQEISIILACTAIQSIVIFIAAIWTTKADRDRKWKAFLYTVPVIIVLNIVRMAAVIYLVYEGITDFNTAHNYLSRMGSMLVLIVLAFYMFDILPELHDNIIGIPGLVKRKGPVAKKAGGATDSSPEMEGKRTIAIKTAYFKINLLLYLVIIFTLIFIITDSFFINIGDDIHADPVIEVSIWFFVFFIMIYLYEKIPYSEILEIDNETHIYRKFGYFLLRKKIKSERIQLNRIRSIAIHPILINSCILNIRHSKGKISSFPYKKEVMKPFVEELLKRIQEKNIILKDDAGVLDQQRRS